MAMKLIVSAIFGALLYIPFSAAVALASKESSLLNMEIKIAPLPHKVAVGFPHDMSDDYYFVKSISRIFFLDKPVVAKIVKVDIHDDMELTLEHSKYGKGTIKIFFTNNNKHLHEASEEELKMVLHRSLSDEKLGTVVVNTKSKIFHLATCNHLPPEEIRAYVTKNVATSSGYKDCGVCFLQLMYLPDFGIEVELQNKVTAELRYYNAPLVDSNMQSRVEGIGRKVLKNWPYPLIGYSYIFTVVESKDINAYAIPAGSIFLTSGLLNTLESDDELEAILAHEITHVERRHSLQTYNRIVSNQQAKAAIGAIGSVVVGVAAAKGNSSAAIGAAGVTLASILAIDLQQNGYSKEQEAESDDFTFRYFNRLKKDLQPVRSVFKKLMYSNLCLKQDPDPSSFTHPEIGSRILELKNQQLVFPQAAVYHIVKDKGPVEIQVLSISERKDESEIVMRVTDLAVFRSIFNYERISFVNGAQIYNYTLDNKDIFTDAWGGLVTARSKIKGFAIQNSTEIEIEESTPDPTNYGYPIFKKMNLTKGAYY